eukprot:5581580-Prymnesium_polylepis.1
MAIATIWAEARIDYGVTATILTNAWQRGREDDTRRHVGLTGNVVTPAVASATHAHAARVKLTSGDGGPDDTRRHVGLARTGASPAVASAAHAHAARVR